MSRRRRNGGGSEQGGVGEAGQKEDDATPPSSPSWVPRLTGHAGGLQAAPAGVAHAQLAPEKETHGGGGAATGSALLLPQVQGGRSGGGEGKRRKRSAYLCRKCKQPKKGHICPVEMSQTGLVADTPAVFEAFAALPQEHTLDRGFTQIIDSALQVDVQTLFENAVSSFYDSSRFAADSWIGDTLVPEAAPSAASCDRVMFGGTWFDMPVTALQSLAGVLREESSTWPAAAQVLARIDETVSFLERSKADFLAHARQHSAASAAGAALPAAMELVLDHHDADADLGLDGGHSPGRHSPGGDTPRLGKRSSTVVLEEAPATAAAAAPVAKRSRRASRRA